jgi:hypothetical protein
VPWQFLGRVYVDTGDRIQFDEVINRLEGCKRGQLFADTLRVAWELVRGDVKSAEQLLAGIIAQVPEMPLPRQMLAQCLERRNAPTTDLLKAYRDVLRVQPGYPQAVAMVRRLEKEGQQPQTAMHHDLNASVYFVGCPSDAVNV